MNWSAIGCARPQPVRDRARQDVEEQVLRRSLGLQPLAVDVHDEAQRDSAGDQEVARVQRDREIIRDRRCAGPPDRIGHRSPQDQHHERDEPGQGGATPQHQHRTERYEEAERQVPIRLGHAPERGLPRPENEQPDRDDHDHDRSQPPGPTEDREASTERGDLDEAEHGDGRLLDGQTECAIQDGTQDQDEADRHRRPLAHEQVGLVIGSRAERDEAGGQPPRSRDPAEADHAPRIPGRHKRIGWTLGAQMEAGRREFRRARHSSRSAKPSRGVSRRDQRSRIGCCGVGSVPADTRDDEFGLIPDRDSCR